MTTYDLCTKLGKILSKHIKFSMRNAGILNTTRSSHRDVSIDINAVHTSLKLSIEKVKRESEKTINSLQEGIDLIESLARKR